MNKKLELKTSIIKILLCALLIISIIPSISQAANNGFTVLVNSPSITIKKPSTNKLESIKITAKAPSSATLNTYRVYNGETENDKNLFWPKLTNSKKSNNLYTEMEYTIEKNFLPEKNKSKTLKIWTKASNMESTRKVIKITNKDGKYYALDNAPNVSDINYGDNKISLTIKSTGNNIKKIEIKDYNANNKAIYSKNSINKKTATINLDRSKVSLKNDSYYRITVYVYDKNGAYTIKEIAFKLPETTNVSTNTTAIAPQSTASKTTKSKTKVSVYQVTDNEVKLTVSHNTKINKILIYDKNNNNKEISTTSNINKNKITIAIKSNKLKIIDNRYSNLILNIIDTDGNKITKNIKLNLLDKTKHKNKLEEVSKNWNIENMDANRIKLVKTAVAKAGDIDYIGSEEADRTNYEIVNNANPKKLSCSAFVGWAYTYSGVDWIFQPCAEYYTDSRFEKISKSKALPGDIVLLNKGGVGDHIGIYIGKNSDGEMTFVHCTGRYGKVPGVIINNEDRFLSSSAVFYRYKGFNDEYRTFELNKTRILIEKGKSTNLKVTNIKSTNTKNPTFTSSNTQIATVDSSGNVYGVKAGKTTITVKEGNVKQKINVTVLPVGDKVYFLDVQDMEYDAVRGSDAIIIESNGKYGMIDTGLNYQKGRVLQYLKDLDIKELEFILITHLHSDHYGAYSKIANSSIKVKNLYIKNATEKTQKARLDNIVEISKKNNIKVNYVSPTENKTITLGNYKFKLLNREIHKLTSDSLENINSIVALAKVNNRTIYFAGDIQNDPTINDYAEDKTAKKAGKVDIYKASHHLYYMNNTSTALKYLKPGYAVITNVKNRPTGTAAAKARLNKYVSSKNQYYTADGTQILTINQNGTISFTQLEADG